MRGVGMLSGGLGSWAANKLWAVKHGPENLTLLFCDTKEEDEDTYRFRDLAARNIGSELVVIADGRTVWQVFRDEGMIGNTRADLCSRILKREPADRWLRDNRDPADTEVILGIHAEEEHRFIRARDRYAASGYRAVAPLCDRPVLSAKEMKDWAAREGLPENGLYRDGFAHSNCFSGETRFLTDEGAKTLAEMAGKSCRVLGTNGSWRPAEIRSFGVQPLLRIELERFNQTKAVHATANHRWFVWQGAHSTNRREVLTANLQLGNRLVSLFGTGLSKSIRPSAYGIAHGIVFGDGHRNDAETCKFTNAADVVLCGEKVADLLRFFPLSPTKDVPGVGVRVCDLPRSFKDRPALSESKCYLFGWLAGYFATDGTICEDGSATISSANLENLLFARDVCVRIGVGSLTPRTSMRVGYGTEPTPLHTLPLIRSTLREDFFLREKHRQRFVGRPPHDRIAGTWKVRSVTPTDRVEEVFCAVEPVGHAFTLEDNILTGNCSGFCVKAGQSHFRHMLKMRPAVYARHEAEEQAFREATGKDVAILRDRRGGRTLPLTMRTFRERIEAGGQCDLFDGGSGCGCFSGEGE